MSNQTLSDTELILIVEDNPIDYEMTVRAFKKTGIQNPIFRCEDGDDALDFLYRRGKYQDNKETDRPVLIILDLNLPGTDGKEVLTQIKADSNLRAIPVIILTTSNNEKDINFCYQHGSNCYLQKPVGIDDFVDTINKLKAFWFNTVIISKEIG